MLLYGSINNFVYKLFGRTFDYRYHLSCKMMGMLIL